MFIGLTQGIDAPTWHSPMPPSLPLLLEHSWGTKMEIYLSIKEVKSYAKDAKGLS